MNNEIQQRVSHYANCEHNHSPLQINFIETAAGNELYKANKSLGCEVACATELENIFSDTYSIFFKKAIHFYLTECCA